MVLFTNIGGLKAEEALKAASSELYAKFAGPKSGEGVSPRNEAGSGPGHGIAWRRLRRFRLHLGAPPAIVDEASRGDVAPLNANQTETPGIACITSPA